jgi:hypothetical protein
MLVRKFIDAFIQPLTINLTKPLFVDIILSIVEIGFVVEALLDN